MTVAAGTVLVAVAAAAEAPRVEPLGFPAAAWGEVLVVGHYC